MAQTDRKLYQRPLPLHTVALPISMAAPRLREPLPLRILFRITAPIPFDDDTEEKPLAEITFEYVVEP